MPLGGTRAEFKAFLVALLTALSFPVIWSLLGLLLIPVGVGVLVLILGAPVFSGAFPFLGAGTSTAPAFTPLVGGLLSLVQWTILSSLLALVARKLTFTTGEQILTTLGALFVVSAITHFLCWVFGIPLHNYDWRM